MDRRSVRVLLWLLAAPTLVMAKRAKSAEGKAADELSLQGNCEEPLVSSICECESKKMMTGYRCSACKDKTKWGYGCDMDCPRSCAAGCDFSGNCIASEDTEQHHCKRNSRTESSAIEVFNERGECQACESGWSGYFCESKCPENCADSAEGLCTRGGKCYKCKSGWYGETCDEVCPEMCPNCVMTDGVVPFPDNPSHFMPAGACAEQCIGNSWGMTCDQQCPKNCKDTHKPSCFKDTGNCIKCQGHLHWGDKCENPCSQGCAGGTCEKDTGDCEKGCKDGWWGSSCEDKCSEFCVGGCNRETGVCKDGCAAGHWGARCDSACPPGTIAGCDRENGMPEECEEGTYPGLDEDTGIPGCLSCPDRCQFGKCNRDGYCTEGCVGHFFGPKCEQGCPTNCDGPCSSKVTGLPDGECKACHPGFTGKRCDKDCHVTCTTCLQHGNAIGPDQCTGCAADEPVFLQKQTNTCECIPGASRSPEDNKCYCDEPDDPMKEAFFVMRPAKECRWICKQGYHEVFGDKESICLTTKVYKAVVVTTEFKQGSCQPNENEIKVNGEPDQCIRVDYIKHIIT